jgi:hypothetical protein
MKKIFVITLVILLLIQLAISEEVVVGAGLKPRITVNEVVDIAEDSPTSSQDAEIASDSSNLESNIDSNCIDCIPRKNINVKLRSNTDNKDSTIIKDNDIINQINNNSGIFLQVVMVILIASIFFMVGYIRATLSYRKR